jgi:ABC-type branched-subunit amino acid transport system substrate-binding protein
VSSSVFTSQRRKGRALLIFSALAAILVLAGCGLRVPASELQTAGAASLGNGTGGGGSSGNLAAGNNGSAPGGSAGTAGGTSTGASGGSGTAGGTGAAGGSGPGGSSSAARSGSGGGTSTGAPPPAPSGGNGGATAPGVTANSITVANVSDVGGPVPGLFAGGPLGVQAYFDYINSQGGIYGRQLKMVGVDDGLQCSQNEASYSDQVSNVFAFVGSWSLDDNCGAQVMQAHPGVPMVQTYLSPDMGNLPNAFGVAPYSANVNTGPLLLFKQKYPSAITAVGTLVGNQASAVSAWDHVKSAMESVGYKVVYEDDFPPAQSNFDADVLRMKEAGVKMVYLQSVNAPDAAIFASEAAQQGFTPQVWLCPVCYFGGYVSESGGASSVNNQWAYVTFADFLGDNTVPEVGTYLHWLNVADSTFSPDEFSAYSWANAALFVKMLEQVGPDLTQAKLLAALKATNTFTDNGMVTPADVGAKTPSNCYNVLQIQNGNWVKVDDPPTGFRCDGSFVP